MKKIFILLGGLIIMSNLTGCETKDKKEIEQSFDKVLAMYPTPNLEDFYDMEGYRDSEFDANDKGVWVLSSEISYSKKQGEPLYSEGMILRMNRNTRKSTGFYYVREISSEVIPIKKEKYLITYDNKGFHLEEEVSDKLIKEKVENFQFFVQYGNFKKLDSYENIRKMYNPEVPMYELEYQLTNEDENVKALRKRYDIPTENAPTLLLKGRGDLEGSSVGYKELEFTFDKKVDVFFSDSVDFQPLSEEDVINE